MKKKKGESLGERLKVRHAEYETAIRKALDTLVDPLTPTEIAREYGLKAQSVKVNLEKMLPDYPSIGIKTWGKTTVIYRKCAAST